MTMDYDIKYMRRAIQLAKSSMEDTHPNPNVGAVIVADGRIIGEGYHRRCGGPHAEVNAVNSVAASDRALLSRATIYVTLEPCSHYGKTPPCAQLIIDSGIPRVVVACPDPFDKVRGRGIAMLRNAGVEVVEDVLLDEARALNPCFLTAHTMHRPYITLKWAQSADGYMDAVRQPSEPHAIFSSPLDATLVHRQRALHDGILTTAATLVADNPRLDVRHWCGPSPTVVVIDRQGVITPDVASRLHLFQSDAGSCRSVILLTSKPLQLPGVDCVAVGPDKCIWEIMNELYERGITSLITECGPRMLQALIDNDLYDNLRVYTSPISLGDRGTCPAPVFD